MKITLVHISDIHIRENWEEDQNVVFTSFFDDLTKQLSQIERNNIYFVFSGDFVLEGAKPALFTKFFNEFDKKLNELYIYPDHRICVPGNHDISRDKVKINIDNHEALVSKKLNEKQFNDYVSKESSNINLLLDKFENYRYFENQFAKIGLSTGPIGGSGWYLNDNIGIYCLNSALCSSGGIEYEGEKVSDKGRLAIDTRNLHNWISSKDVKTRILIMHHPIDWLTDWAKTELKTIIKKDFSLFLYGHNHEQDVYHYLNTESYYVECSAPPLFTSKKDNLGYSIITLDADNGVSEIIYRQWTRHHSFVSGVNFSNTDDGKIKCQSKNIIENTNNINIINTNKDFITKYFEDKLEEFIIIFPSQPVIWIEPIIHSYSELSKINDNDMGEEPINIANIITDTNSLVIKALPQFGLTCLAIYLCKEAWSKNNDFWIYIDANQVKPDALDREIQKQCKIVSPNLSDVKCIILDSWSASDERHQLLLTKMVNNYKNIRIIVMQTIDDTRVFIENFDTSTLNRDFKILYLWTLTRSRVRNIVAKYNEKKYIGDENAVVEKILSDLEVLNLHRTPLNCFTLLKTMEVDFDESPVNRAEMIKRVLFLLFNDDDIPTYRIRPDLKDCEYVLGYLCQIMIMENNFGFSRDTFIKRISSFCKEQLIDLDVDILFDILNANHIIINREGLFYFRFSYWIYYFTAQRMYHSQSFLEYIFAHKVFYPCPEIIEFFTGIDRRREEAIRILITDLQYSCDFVKERCGFREEMNVYRFAQWRSSPEAIEKMKNELSDGVMTSTLPEEIKDRYADTQYDRTKPYNQDIQIIFEELSLLNLYQIMRASARALRNSDYVDPALKITMLDLLLKSWEQLAKVLLVISPILAREGFATFDGLSFFLAGDFGSNFEEKFNNIIGIIPMNIISWVKDDIYSNKMGSLLINQLTNEENDIRKHFLVMLLINQKPNAWKSSIEDYIASVSKNSFFLYDISQALKSQYIYSFASFKTLEDIKYLYKMTLAKHLLGIKRPSPDKIKKISDKYLGDIDNF
jgi:predicted MPP superfamily phosphohydrolase